MAILPKGGLNKSDGDSRRLVRGSVVEYEQHGKPVLAIVKGFNREKCILLNSSGSEVSLLPKRIYLYPEVTSEKNISSGKSIEFLRHFDSEIEEIQSEISLSEIWEVHVGNERVIPLEEFVCLIGDKQNARIVASVRRLLNSDAIFFKRTERGYIARPENIVDELKRKAEVEAEKKRKFDQLVDTFQRAINGEKVEFPPEISSIEKLALGIDKPKDAKTVIEKLFQDKEKNSGKGWLEDQALRLLIDSGYYSPTENLTIRRIERETVHTFTDCQTIEKLSNDLVDGLTEVDALVYTIDARGTEDMDDAISIEQTINGWVVGVHITDVASLVERDSELDLFARELATSIYCTDQVYPMFPNELSSELLSLRSGTKRPVISFIVEFDNNFKEINRTIKHQTVTISKSFDYEEIDAILYDECTEEDCSPEFRQNIGFLWDLAVKLESRRIQNGAAQIFRRECEVRIGEDEHLFLEDYHEDTPARRLVSELMILANETAALFAESNSIPLLFRSQEPPDEELVEALQFIPEGVARDFARRGTMKRSISSTQPLPHSSLGLSAYCQVTSPIRRYADLVNQRQLLSFISDQDRPYNASQIDEVLVQLEPGLAGSRLIYAERGKFWKQSYLKQEKIKELTGVVAKIAPPRAYVELDIFGVIWQFKPIGLSHLGYKGKLKEGDRVTLFVQRNRPMRGDLLLVEKQ